MKRLVCKHGNPVGVEIAPAEFYHDPAGREGHIIQRVTMPVCEACLLDALMDAMENQTRPLHDQL